MNPGLSNKEALKRLREFGYNEITEREKTSPFTILLRQIKGNFVLYLLIFSAILSFFVGKVVTTYVILFVIMLVVTIGFFLEYKAEKAIEALKRMVNDLSTVVRDGKETEIPSRELVPGDIILLRSGERIPADAIILESHNIQVNESVLTGESKEIEKNQITQNQQHTENNMVFMGCFVVNGKCIAQITNTGMKTQFGNIAQMIATAEKEMPLQTKINHITKYMIIVSVTFSLLTGLLMFLRSDTLSYPVIVDILVVVIALSVSTVPEGLPVVLVTTLANGAIRMAKKNAIVNKMSIIGTIGGTTVVCSDKTGTITKGEMTVKKMYTNETLYDISGNGFESEGSLLLNNKKNDWDNHTIQLLLIRCGKRFILKHQLQAVNCLALKFHWTP